MKKYINNLEEKVSSVLNESLVSDAAELVGIEEEDAEERIQGLSFANYIELGNAIDLEDAETAREILSTVAPIETEVEETSGAGGAGAGAVGVSAASGDIGTWDGKAHKKPKKGLKNAGKGVYESEGEQLYHVTHTKYVPQIQKNGLRPMGAPSNWVQQGSGDRYGMGEIYVFTSREDAKKWAGRMDWDFNQTIGSGEISILTINRPEGQDFEKDEADPMSQAGQQGEWLKTYEPIEPENIVGAQVFKSMNESRLDENTGMVLFGQRVAEAVQAGTITQLEAVLISLLAIAGPALLMLGWGGVLGDWMRSFGRWKDAAIAKRKINPEQIKELADEATSTLKSIKRPGQRKFLLSLINKYKAADMGDKNELYRLQREIEGYMDKMSKLDEADENVKCPECKKKTMKRVGKFKHLRCTECGATKKLDEAMDLLDKPTMTVREIAEKHGVPVADIASELAMGIKVELEHSNNRKVAKEIALDHLMELPDYYTRLDKMENEGELDEVAGAVLGLARTAGGALTKAAQKVGGAVAKGVKAYANDKAKDYVLSKEKEAMSEADNPYASAPSQGSSIDALAQKSSGDSEATADPTVQSKDVDDLMVGDDIEVIDIDGDPTPVTVKNPRAPSDTLIVQTDQGEEHIVKKQAVSGTPVIQEMYEKALREMPNMTRGEMNKSEYESLNQSYAIMVELPLADYSDTVKVPVNKMHRNDDGGYTVQVTTKEPSEGTYSLGSYYTKDHPEAKYFTGRQEISVDDAYEIDQNRWEEKRAQREKWAAANIKTQDFEEDLTYESALTDRVHEAYNANKTEHSGAKKGKGGYHGRKKDAKRDSNKKRRADDKKAISEVAPPGMEDWIKKRKPDFKKQYGDDWEKVLYATAWKRHNNESIEEEDQLGFDFDPKPEWGTRRGDILRVVNTKEGPGLKVKGMGGLLGVGDWVELEDGTNQKIMKIGRGGVQLDGDGRFHSIKKIRYPIDESINENWIEDMEAENAETSKFNEQEWSNLGFKYSSTWPSGVTLISMGDLRKNARAKFKQEGWKKDEGGWWIHPEGQYMSSIEFEHGATTVTSMPVPSYFKMNETLSPWDRFFKDTCDYCGGEYQSEDDELIKFQPDEYSLERQACPFCYDWNHKGGREREEGITEAFDPATHVNVEHRDPEGRFIIVHVPPAGYWAVGKGQYQHDIDRTSFDNFDDALDHAEQCLASLDEGFDLSEIRRLAGLKETASAGATGAGAVATAPTAMGGMVKRNPSIYGKPEPKKRKKETTDDGLGRSKKK